MGTLPTLPRTQTATGCHACREQRDELFPFTMAFQPIVNALTRHVYSYEALVRGPGGESAYSVLSQVNEANRYIFDQECRVKAIALAAQLRLPDSGARLSINFMPGAVYSPAACIQRTLSAAREHQFPLDRLTFEITEDERVHDVPHLQAIVQEYHRHGFSISFDDFGAGYSGLKLLSELQPNAIKLDGTLVRNIDTRPVAQQIVSHMTDLAAALDIALIAECVETVEEAKTLLECGAYLFQGYLFARPQLESLPTVTWPDLKIEQVGKLTVGSVGRAPVRSSGSLQAGQNAA